MAANPNSRASFLTKVASFLVTMFLVASVTVPTAVLNKIVFGLIAVVAIVRIALRSAHSPFPTWSPIVILTVFLYGMVLGLGGDTDGALARQMLFSVSLLFLVYPILWFGVDLDRAVKIAGLSIVLGTVVLVLSVILSTRSSLATTSLELLERYSLSRSGERLLVGDPVAMFRLGSAPFLFLPFALFTMDVRNRPSITSVTGLVLVSGAIVASASRGLLVVSTLAVGLVVMQRASHLGRAAWAALAIPVVGVAAVVLSATDVFSASEFSNSIKVGHALSFVDHLDLTNAFFGEGLAAHYFSEGQGRIVAQTEITLLDQLRYFGFLLTAVVGLALVFPTLRRSAYLGHRTRQMSVGLFALYLLLSLTNPVLFNSTGLSIVVWYWWRLLRPDEAAHVSPA